MKLKVWTVTCDDDNGTYALTFGSEAEAKGWVWTHVIAPRTDAETLAGLRANSDLPAALNQVLGEHRMDYYGIEPHEIEVGEIAVILQGGMAQCAVTNGQALLDGHVLIIDYDTDGAEALTDVYQDTGNASEALVWAEPINAGTIHIPHLFPNPNNPAAKSSEVANA